MPDEFSPDLGGLESDYRIQTELRHSRRSRTYLARHLGLNRDVNIQVLGVPGNEPDNSLTLFASDARTLSVIRHPNVVPVIEARWLAGGAFAVVRPHVRGLLLDEVVAAEGPLAASRVAKYSGKSRRPSPGRATTGSSIAVCPARLCASSREVDACLWKWNSLRSARAAASPTNTTTRERSADLAFEMLAGRKPDDDRRSRSPSCAPTFRSASIRDLAAAMTVDRRGRRARPERALTAHLAACSRFEFCAASATAR